MKDSYEHPTAGTCRRDPGKLAIRWQEGAPPDERDALLEELKLVLFRLEAPEAAEAGRRPLRTANQTGGLSWVESEDGGPLGEDAVAALEGSELVHWVSPGLVSGAEGEEGPEPESVSCVDPTRLYVPAGLESAVAGVSGEELPVSVDTGRSPRLPGWIAVRIEDPSVAEGRSALELAGRLAEALRGRPDVDPERVRIRFENIPLVSPTCGHLECRPRSTERAPDDPLFGDEWGMRRIRAPYAWHLTRGDPDVVVAVIDEGVELAHPDLTLHPDSWNATTDTPDGSPVGDHGTACAGIAGGVADNARGVAGVAGDSRLMAIATATWSDIDVAEGLYFAADHGARVVSMSFGVYPSWGAWDFDLIRDALQYALDRDLVLVAASGNEDRAESRFPGSDSRTLCVGGSNRADRRKRVGDSSSESWWGACYGPDLDVVAPCLEIPTTDRLGAAGYAAGDYTLTFNGTSSATPHVAGLAALLLSLRPDLSNETVREVIERTCDKVSPGTYEYEHVGDRPSGTWNEEMGYGRINAERAVLVACSEGREGREPCEDVEVCLPGVPDDCRSPAAPPWKPYDQCLYWYEHRVVGARDGQCQFRVVVQHCMRLDGRQQGPLLFTTTLLPGETQRLYHYDRYRRVRSEEEQVSVHASLRQTVSALWQTGTTTSVSEYREQIETERRSSDASASVGGLLSFFGVGGGVSESERSTERSVRSLSVDRVHSEFSRVVRTASQQLEAERSLVVSTYEDEEHRDVTSRTLENDNACHAVTYFVRRVHECYRLSSTVESVEWRCRGRRQRGWGPWRPIDELEPERRKKLGRELRDLPGEGDTADEPRPVTVPTEGAVYEAELAHCSSCEPERQQEARAELERIAARARKERLEAEAMELELRRRRELLERGDLEPFGEVEPAASGAGAGAADAGSDAEAGRG